MTAKRNSQEAEKVQDTEDLLDGIHYTGDKGPCFGARHSMIIMASLATSLSIGSGAAFQAVLFAMTSTNGTSNSTFPTYDWNNQGTITSAAKWLSIPVFAVAGYLAKQYGHKWFLFVGVLLNQIFFLLLPVFASFGGSIGVMFCRAISGGAAGLIMPAGACISGLWVPPEERSKMGMVAVGVNFALIMMSGFAAAQIGSSSIGYPGFCYIFGSLGFLWCVAWYFLGFQSPETHPRITPEEKKYLETTLKVHETENLPVPWKKLLTSVHFWAPISGIIGTSWLDSMYEASSSVYAKQVWQLDLATTSVFSFTPLVGLVVGAIFAPISDFLIQKNYLRTVNARRIFHTYGITGSTLALLAMTWIPPKSLGLAIAHSCITSTFSLFFNIGGAGMNMLDIAPSFASIISGFSSTLAGSLSLFANFSVDWMVKDKTDAGEWRNVFYLTAGIVAATTLFFVLFATDKRQWENLEEKDEQNTENKEEQKEKENDENKDNEIISDQV